MFAHLRRTESLHLETQTFFLKASAQVRLRRLCGSRCGLTFTITAAISAGFSSNASLVLCLLVLISMCVFVGCVS